MAQVAYKFRCYPTKEQELLLAKIFGSVRWVYNQNLIKKRDTYKNTGVGLSHNELSRQLTEQKQTDEYSWLKEVPRTCLTISLMDLDRSYKNFFEKRSGYPKLKNRYAKKSARFQDVVFTPGTIKLPKLGVIKTKFHREVIGIPKTATISKNKTGEYYISFMTDQVIDLLPVTGDYIGIDVGLKSFYVDSNGVSVDNPRYLRNKQRALKRSQRAHARAKTDSNRKERKRIKIAKLHQKITNTRKDFLNKQSIQLVRNYDVIVVEDLKIKNMMKNHHLAGSIADSSWGEFIRQLEYKSNWYGKSFVKVSPNYTSRDCSQCGHRHETKMVLSIRSWTCSQCGTDHDRDHNAAINILNRGLDLLDIPMGTGKFTNADIIAYTDISTEMSASSMDEALICLSQARADDSALVQ
jgi:putative transposase